MGCGISKEKGTVHSVNEVSPSKAGPKNTSPENLVVNAPDIVIREATSVRNEMGVLFKTLYLESLSIHFWYFITFSTNSIESGCIFS